MRNGDSSAADELVELLVCSGSIHKTENVIRPHWSLGKPSNGSDSFSQREDIEIRIEEVGVDAGKVKGIVCFYGNIATFGQRSDAE